jgi:uncharacterized protein DUF4388/tetratricopeptide repeat protein
VAIEGPLRELSIHDVFQMLDLSRKTGALRVTSELRDNDGTVLFDRGRVISASIRSSQTPLGLMLVRAGRITDDDLAAARSRQASGDPRRLGEILQALGAIGARELERQVRLQVEAVVFELMSWRDGFFSFEECDVGAEAIEAAVHVSTESLLMEAARRIDEWSRIVETVPNVGVVPVLAAVHDDHATLLDLLPSEWELLATIDGDTDLRGIAGFLGRSEFDVAKVVYGLVSTGVLELRDPVHRNGSGATAAGPAFDLSAARDALAGGRAEEALTVARAAIGAEPRNADARLMAARALRALRRFGDASEELRQAAEIAPDHPSLHLEQGYAALSRGDFQAAVTSWNRYLESAPPASAEAEAVRAALTSASHLREVLEAHAGV